MTYRRFLAMIATSTLVMYALTYLNSYRWDHVWPSETRAWMALMMGAVMTIIMLAFMWPMYRKIERNLIIIAGAVVIFTGSLWLVRSQNTVGDIAYMEAMIPHHSIAILTSSRANIRDPRVRDLADRIIEAQVREIDEMQSLIRDIERNGTRGSTALPPEIPVR